MHMFSQCHAYIAENVLLDSRLALFHEEDKWLAVADLHFGFELSQRMAGHLFPLWGMESIEARLHELLRDYQPSKLILVGDLVHDKSAAREFFSLITRLREQSVVVQAQILTERRNRYGTGGRGTRAPTDGQSLGPSARRSLDRDL